MNFAHPFWLLLLVLIPVLGITAAGIARVRKKQWEVFMAGRLRSALLQTTPAFTRWLSLTFLLAGLSLLVIALARPQGDAGTRAETVKGRNILFALDLSRSMKVQDVKPDRLTQGKVIIYEMMEAMPNDKMGLVGFAGEPYLFAPLTVDHGAVKETVEQLDETWIPNGGSDLVKALRFSIDVLKKTGVQNNALVFISDGEKHDGDLERVVKEAALAGVYVFAIGVGTESGDWVPEGSNPGEKMVNRQGENVLSRLQPDILRELAVGTQGRFVVAGTGVDIPALAKTALADLDQFELQGRETKVVVEFYQWLLGPAILLIFLAVLLDTRWRALAKKTAVAATLATTLTGAQGATPDEAKMAMTDKRFEEASAAYRGLAESVTKPEDSARWRLAEGAAEYGSTNFRKAAEAYSRALLSDDPQVDRNAHLGAGSSLFNLGWQSLGEDRAYPDPAPENMEAFDTLVKTKLQELAEKELPDAGETETFKVFNELIKNWTDAVRHYNSALKLQPGDPDAIQNRALTIRYLHRLEELLQEQSDESSQQIPQEIPGPPQPQEGEEGEDGEGAPGEKGKKGDQPEDDKSGGDQEEKEKEDGKGDEKKDEKKDGETPEEHAKRKLRESEDMQKGPITPGRREFRRPEKDW